MSFNFLMYISPAFESVERRDDARRRGQTGAAMSALGTSRTADRVVTSVAARRSTILEVIRNVRQSIALSLFRCNDAEVFAELASATGRGVKVDAIVTSRAKGGKAKLQKLWTRLAGCGASVHAFSDPVVKYHAKYLVADEGPAVIASCNFTRK